jgi:hypothetical protein
MTKADTGNNITLVGIKLAGIKSPEDFIKCLQNRDAAENILKHLLQSKGLPVVQTHKKQTQSTQQKDVANTQDIVP